MAICYQEAPVFQDVSVENSSPEDTARTALLTAQLVLTPLHAAFAKPDSRSSKDNASLNAHQELTSTVDIV